ncbi:tyrosine-type recombinase/integrase [Pseudoxanthomonas mexicana]
MLTLSTIKAARPQAKPYRLTDFGGLFMLVKPSGSKLWRWKYRRPGSKKENLLSFGSFPSVSLQEARDAREDASRLLRRGVDPGLQKKVEKLAAATNAATTFGAIADEYFDKREGETAGDPFKRDRNRFDNHLRPLLGSLPIADVTAAMLLVALRKPEAAGKLETVRRLRAMSGRIFRYAMLTQRASVDPSALVKGHLKTPKPAHFAAATDPKDLPDLLRALWGYAGGPVVSAALKLTPLLFVRHGELRSARWVDIDLEAGEWRYVVSKTGTPHIVPLSKQAVAIFRDLHRVTGHREFAFPNARSGGRHMSQVATLSAMRRLELPAELVTNHGWRATARTLLDEVLHVPPHLIEHQLAHTVKDPLGRAYNRTAHLPERKKMMQAWSDYLDGLRTSSNVVPFEQNRA